MLFITVEGFKQRCQIDGAFMKKYFWLLLVILNYSLIYSQSKITDLGPQGMELVYDMKFNEANDIFDKIIKLEPKNGYGYFLKSVCYFWMYLKNPQDEAVGEKYKEISFKSVDVAVEMLDKNEDDVDAMFYLGGAYGNLGRYYSMDKSWWKAYWDGKKGKNYLKDVVEKDPKYYDAYLGLGIYHYYADVLPKFIKFFSFILGIEGDKEQGIKELQLAISKSKNTRTEAMFFLGAIYTDIEKDFKKALPIFKELFDKYPNNSIFGLALGKSYWKLGKYELAKNQFQLIFDKFSNDKKVIAYLNTYGYQLLEQGSYDEAIEVFQKQVKIFPNKANSYDSLGDGYRKAGKIKLAVEQYKKALKIDPGFEESKEKLKELNLKK